MATVSVATNPRTWLQAQTGEGEVVTAEVSRGGGSAGPGSVWSDAVGEDD